MKRSGREVKSRKTDARFRRVLHWAEIVLVKQGRQRDAWKCLQPIIDQETDRVVAFGSSMDESEQKLGAISPSDGDAMLWTRDLPEVAKIVSAVARCPRCKSELAGAGREGSWRTQRAIALAESHHAVLYAAYRKALEHDTPPELLEDAPVWVAAQTAAVMAAALNDLTNEGLQTAAFDFFRTRVATLRRLHRQRRVAAIRSRKQSEGAHRNQRRSAAAKKKGTRLPHARLVTETVRYLLKRDERHTWQDVLRLLSHSEVDPEILDSLNRGERNARMEGTVVSADTPPVEYDEQAGKVYFYFGNRNERAITLKRFKNLVAAAVQELLGDKS